MRKAIFLFAGFCIGWTVMEAISCSPTDTITNKIELPKSDTVKTIQKDTFGLNQQYVYNMIVEADIQHPEIVLRQAILETGWFKSSVCKFNYNLFGFTGMNGYMKYDTYQESIDSYKLWQDKFYYSGNYYVFLEDIHYAEDTNYVETLKRIKINIRKE